MNNAKKPYDGKIAGLYDLEETLGRGHFAVVKLARHVFTGEKVAVKVIDKTKLDEVSRAHLFQEVRCMKLVQHPNVVRLYEVIDTQTKLYLILELGDGGDLYDYIMKHETGLGEDRAKEYFRQIVRAISYCHQLHVVHRDLKPENVVFFERLGVVKLTDFGFSNKFCPGQKLDTSCGSLAYSAPEILLGDSYDAPAVDVWSLGVILYMLVAGQAPFQEANDSETLTMIMDCKYTIPTHVSEACRKLIAKMLVREPEFRATLDDIASDPWLGGSSQVEYLPLVSRHQVTDEDHNLIINKMVNGNIATKDEVLDALDRNEYNHITATYFLLAERKLRTYRQEQDKNKKENDDLNAGTITSKNSSAKVHTSESASSEALSLPLLTCTLNVPRTPGDSPHGKVRKCSIVQEEEDEEQYCTVVGSGQELAPPHSLLNRRGSRSEGKLNIAIQERLAEERLNDRKESPGTSPHYGNVDRNASSDDANRSVKRSSPTALPSGTCASFISNYSTRRMFTTSVVSAQNSLLNSKSKLEVDPFHADSKDASSDFVKHSINRRVNKECNVVNKSSFEKAVSEIGKETVLSSRQSQTSSASSKLKLNQEVLNIECVSLKDSATIAVPIHAVSKDEEKSSPKYKTMPSPYRISSRETPFAFCGISEASTLSENRPTGKGIVCINCDQRKSKFLKSRTASCSSSDASDDDSESGKKRAHKIAVDKSDERRDSHDDSSDSPDRSGNGGAGSNPASNLGSGGDEVHNQGPLTENQGNTSTGSGDQSTGSTYYRQCNGETFRRNRRRAGETRLRESQSLNRIMEVQESDAANYTACNPELFRQEWTRSDKGFEKEAYSCCSMGSEKSKCGKSLGARFLRSWSNTISSTKLSVQKRKVPEGESKRSCLGDASPSEFHERLPKNYSDEKENKVFMEKTGRKIKVLGRYFQVSRKICIPIPGFSSKGRIYKARSCGSISKDKISLPMTSGTGAHKSAAGNGVVHSKIDREEGVHREARKKSNFFKNREREKDPTNRKTRGVGGDINRNTREAKGDYVCPSVGLCHMHMRDAAKCHLS